MDTAVSFLCEGQRISGHLEVPYPKAPGVLLSHGLESSSDGRKWILLASRLRDLGFASLRFSYRGCGTGESRSEGEFHASTLTARIKDYRCAINFLQENGAHEERLAAIGSSFGGRVALAARDPRIKVMVLMATPCEMPPLANSPHSEPDSQGRVQLASGVHLPATIYEDARRHNVLGAVRDLGLPLLILHGSEDEVVPVSDAQTLFSRASGVKRIEILQGANHSFDHPTHLRRALDLAVDWIQAYL